MPSTSKAQQRYFGMVHAIQKGELAPSKVSPEVRETAHEIKPGDATDFAATKRKGLPEHHHKKESGLRSVDRLYMADTLGRLSPPNQ